VDCDHAVRSKRSGGMVIHIPTRAASDQDDIGAGRHNRFTNGCHGAIDAALIDDETTVAGNQAREQRSICIVDGPERQGCLGFDDVVSSKNAT
jgi:hypothetical protein